MTPWALSDHGEAIKRLRVLADELARSHPGAAASLREGLQETVTVTRLKITRPLKRTLESTNPCESMIECVRPSSRNVKHWQFANAIERDRARALAADTPRSHPSSMPEPQTATLVTA